MRDLQPDSWPDERAGTGWPGRASSGHPIVAGVLCLAIAVGTWHGLLWALKRTAEVGGSVPAPVAPVRRADPQVRPDTHRVVLKPRTPPPLPGVAAAPHSPPRPPRSSVLSGSTPRSSPTPATPGTGSDSAPRGSGEPSPSESLSDSPPRSKLSPFRRSHPWAAPAGGRYYYPSSCPATLRLPDLEFFKSEAEALARGFRPSRLPGCE